MLETKIDKYGRQLCPFDRSLLELHGAWSYDGRIRKDKYAFRCTKCWHGFVGNGEEMETHQDGIEAAKMQKRVNLIKLRIKKPHVRK